MSNLINDLYPNFVDPDTGRALAGGQVYIGNPDTDPTVEANRKALTLVQEDGTEVSIAVSAQPLTLSQGGVFEYNGSPVQVYVSGDYSLTAQTNTGAQKYYYPVNVELRTVSTYTEMRALSTTKASLVGSIYVLGRSSAGDGGEGHFRWVSGDQSTNVSNDPGEGVWVAPDSDATGASGAWERLFNGSVYVEWWGAFGTASDDREEINNAISWVNQDGGGRVVISRDHSVAIPNTSRNTVIEMKSNVTLEFVNGASITLNANGENGYRVVGCEDIDDFEIIRPYLIGDKDTHTAGTGEFGMCLEISGCNRFLVDRPRCEKGWGDGIYVGAGSQGYCQDGEIRFPELKNNRRNNMSIISVINVLVDGGYYDNANGTAPQAGIDVEPNNATDKLQNLVIRNPETRNNTRNGISVIMANLDNTSDDIDVTIEGHTSRNDGARGAAIGLNSASQPNGSVRYNSAHINTPSTTGIYVANWGDNGPWLYIDKPVIIDPNDSDGTSNADDVGISLNIPSGSNVTDLNNIVITNPYVDDRRSTKKIQATISIINNNGGTVDNVFIEDPVFLVQPKSGANGIFISPDMSTIGLFVSDIFRQISKDTGTFTIIDSTLLRGLTTDDKVSAFADTSPDGYTLLPGGVILQWGNETISANTTSTITMPVAFPNTFFNASATFDAGDNTLTSSPHAQANGLNQINVTNTDGSQHVVFWMALGN